MSETGDVATQLESERIKQITTELKMYEDLRISDQKTHDLRMELMQIEAFNKEMISKNGELVDKWAARREKELMAEQMVASDNFFKGFEGRIEQLKLNYEKLGQIGANIAEGLVDGLTDSIWELTKATDGFDESLKNVARTLADMAGKAVLKNLLSFGMGAVMNSFNPVAFTSTGTGTAGGLGSGAGGMMQMHSGGIVAHSGTVVRSDERMIKAKVGEGVFTADQMKALGTQTRDDETKRMLSEIRDKIGPPNIALFDDRQSMEEWATSKRGNKTIVQVSRRNRRAING